MEQTLTAFIMAGGRGVSTAVPDTGAKFAILSVIRIPNPDVTTVTANDIAAPTLVSPRLSSDLRLSRNHSQVIVTSEPTILRADPA